ncbi:putative serine acetyltransferase 4 [Capsicum baccatum]|uniref:Serine acetyltransferase 4 n=1 Tax=Capsicum baccatum TaxID=33114 RepID=A0A2G2XBB1_CAPBA|nr:putative serine acetyltransferase 4 [Capsicum baccatum]
MKSSDKALTPEIPLSALAIISAITAETVPITGGTTVEEIFAVDIHLGVKIGKRILLDHATGVFLGETTMIGNNFSILHMIGDRHPKIGDGVLISAGTYVLGNVRIEDKAKIGAVLLR